MKKIALIGLNIYSVSPYTPEDDDFEDEDNDKGNLLRCRYVQCGFFDKDLFSGMISDYQGGGVYAVEYWTNGVCLGYDEEDELFFDYFDVGFEIQEMFKTYVDEEDATISKDDLYNCFDDVDGEFYQLKNVAKIKPISSHKGLTQIAK